MKGLYASVRTQKATYQRNLSRWTSSGILWEAILYTRLRRWAMSFTTVDRVRVGHAPSL